MNEIVVYLKRGCPFIILILPAEAPAAPRNNDGKAKNAELRTAPPKVKILASLIVLQANTR